MKRLYQGGCHCGAVRFEAQADLDETTRCNCSICARTRLWKVDVEPAEVRILTGESQLQDYTFGSGAVHHRFCRTCGVKVLGSGQNSSGPFAVLSVAALDATDEELSSAGLTYQDGRNDKWERPPAVSSFL